jgi:molybdopterin/thiamine biosynthesis adenylyltransferase
MDEGQTMSEWRLTIPENMFDNLMRHLYPGDNDEHGAIILAGVVKSDRGLRLTARELHLAVDGVDYVPGQHGYRMLRAQFIQSRILRARDLQLGYLAIHNHSGGDTVSFSPDDMASHERGYPALLDIARGMPVGALVFAPAAVAGDLWFPGRKRAALGRAAIVGARRKLLYPRPPRAARRYAIYDRQARLFGDSGQRLLRDCRVGIIGLGGAGSILAELLGRLGVGEFVLADPDYADPTNLPRLIAANRSDAMAPSWIPARLKRFFQRPKVKLAARNIRRANRAAKIAALHRNFLDADVAARFTDCDYLFLAADTMSARLLFNALVHQYGIPGVQVGAKVPVAKTGEVGDVFCVSRAVTPELGCLWCNGLISPGKLQDEAVPDFVRQDYAYVDDAAVTAPSVVTLNAIACAHAADDFLFHITGLKYDTAESGWFRWNSRRNQASCDIPRADSTCPECSTSDNSRLGRGDNVPLPTRPAQ